jgi:hypothetical protein
MEDLDWMGAKVVTSKGWPLATEGRRHWHGVCGLDRLE